MRQLLDHAAENGYGLPAFNVNNMEQVWAICEAASQIDAPVIMQASAGARKYAGEPFLRHQILAALEAQGQRVEPGDAPDGQQAAQGHGGAQADD
jgi:fructose-bisphosphate aldolase class II